MKNSWKRNILIYLVILVAAVAVFTYLLPTNDKPEEVPLSEVIALSQNKEISEIEVEEEALLVKTVSGEELKSFKESNASIYEIEGLNLEGVVVDIKGSSGFNWGGLLLNLVPLMIFGALLFLLFRQARGANSQAMSFGRSKARLFAANRPTVTFDDVAGVDEAKQDLQEVVEFLRAREKFHNLGARIPRGVLLVGPPGTGKTLLARAIAGEAGVPFFSISGSEFVEMFVGVGASRVRDLFEQGKRNAPAIVFIDEIDAVGRQRGAGLGGSHDEREQTLNQILVEMDGFDTSVNLIIMAATNRPDILDPALLRPGRFDRRVVLDSPDISGRLAILKVHTQGKPLDENVDLSVVAKGTVGFSGADLANLVNEAALLSARRNKKNMGMKEFEESVDRVIAGPERRSRKITPKEKEIIAYHESGHALVAHTLPNADPVHKISIVARGMSLGHTRQLPIEDRYLMSRGQFKDTMSTLLAGHVAEELIFGEITTGAQDDIGKATRLARMMVTDYGMSEKLGTRTFGHKEEMVFLGREISEQRDYSERFAMEIDQEVNRLIKEAYNHSKQVLTEKKEKLKDLAGKLIAEETIESEALEELLSEAKPARSRRKVKKTKVPAPAAPAAEAEPDKPKKSPAPPKLVPEQNPAPSD